MAEKPQLSPEVRLFARMRLQRVVFGAFAIVLVSLFALGLSAYREMQNEREAARLSEQDALAKKLLSERHAADVENMRRKTLSDLEARERELALSKCRLAMVEVHEGNIARAADLLNEAQALVPPRWAPLVRQLTKDAPVRFMGSKHPDMPVIAGAVSSDGNVVATARQTDDGVVVETWSVADGELLTAYPPASPVPSITAEVSRLLISRDGSSWFLPLPELSFYGSAGRVTQVDMDLWPKGVPLTGVAANDTLSVIYIAAQELLRLELNGPYEWGISPYPLVDGPVLNLALVDSRLVLATSVGVYGSDASGVPVLIHTFEDPPDRAALHCGAGALFVGALRGGSLSLVAAALRENGHLETTRHEMPGEACQDLLFLRDGSLVWVGRTGRAYVVDFDGKREWNLGGYTVSFIERHPQGLMFANHRGDLNVRVQDELRVIGRPLHTVPPRFAAEARAHGFVLKAPWPALIVVGDDVTVLESAVSVALGPQGACWRDEEHLRLPGGALSNEQGVVLGVFNDGSVVLHDSPRKLKLVGAQGVVERLLPVERVPENVVVAAAARVVAMRVQDNVYVTDFSADPEPVANRMGVSPDLLALDATGTSLAVAYGATIVVQSLANKSERTVRTNAPPRQIALLFGGTVLVTIETGVLVFYEVETGRELLRAGNDVTSIAAAGENTLNVVASNSLCKLAWN